MTGGDRTRRANGLRACPPCSPRANADLSTATGTTVGRHPLVAVGPLRMAQGGTRPALVAVRCPSPTTGRRARFAKRAKTGSRNGAGEAKLDWGGLAGPDWPGTVTAMTAVPPERFSAASTTTAGSAAGAEPCPNGQRTAWTRNAPRARPGRAGRRG